MAMLDYDSYTKQRFGAFNNKKFRFNPLLENKAFDFFKEQIKKNPEMMTAITNAAAKSKTSVDVILNQQTKDKLLNFKNTVIQDNANPESLFKQVAKASDIDPKDILTGQKQVPDVIKKLLSVEEGRTVGELAAKGVKVDKDVATFNALNAGLDVVLGQGKQMYGKLAFDDYIRTGLNTIDNPRINTHTRIDG